jgi:hypothetical protein
MNDAYEQALSTEDMDKVCAGNATTLLSGDVNIRINPSSLLNLTNQIGLTSDLSGFAVTTRENFLNGGFELKTGSNGFFFNYGKDVLSMRDTEDGFVVSVANWLD